MSNSSPSKNNRERLPIFVEGVYHDWMMVPVPADCNLVIDSSSDSLEVEEFFKGKASNEISLSIWHPGQSEALFYLTKEAVHYYIQAYLTYCIRVIIELEGEYRLDQTCTHLIGYLTGKRYLGKNYVIRSPKFSSQQRSRISEFLEWVMSLIEEVVDLGQIQLFEQAINFWKNSKLE